MTNHRGTIKKMNFLLKMIGIPFKERERERGSKINETMSYEANINISSLF
jgi:hypothetical protein